MIIFIKLLPQETFLGGFLQIYKITFNIRIYLVKPNLFNNLIRLLKLYRIEDGTSDAIVNDWSPQPTLNMNLSDKIGFTYLPR